MAIIASRFTRVYDPSPSAEDRWYINDHTILQDASGLWHMIGITHAEPANPFDEKFFAHAIAPDPFGLWTRRAPVLPYDPSHGESHVWAPHAIAHEGRFYMYYCGGGQTPQTTRIQLATSDDLFYFTRHRDNPMVVDGYEARDPMVFHHAGLWRMVYTANETPAGGHHTVAMVESTDLIHWSNKREVFRSSVSGTGGGPTESPFVVARGGKFYLFVCTNTPYLDTAVYVADTPFHWREADRVGQIRAHAAEVIHVPDRRWLISSCGWGTGGLYLAELEWGG